jgi:hypothetical protein
VYRRLLEENADVGLATVYRVLAQLEQAGILARSTFDSGKAVFEINEGRHHDHLVCVRCGRVEEFHDAAIEKRQIATSCTSTAWRSTACVRSVGPSRLADDEADLAAGVAGPDADHRARRCARATEPATVLHLLDYIAVDYAGAVDNRRVKSADEYKEMQVFAAQAQTLIAGLPSNSAQAALRAGTEARAGREDAPVTRSYAVNEARP